MKMKVWIVISLILLLLFNAVVVFRTQKFGDEFSEKLRVKNFYQAENYKEKRQLENAILLSTMSQNCRERVEVYSDIIKRYYDIVMFEDEEVLLEPFIDKIRKSNAIEISIFNRQDIGSYFDEGINKEEILKVLRDKNEIAYENFEYEKWSFVKYLNLDNEKILFIKYFFFPQKIFYPNEKEFESKENYDDVIYKNFYYAPIASFAFGIIFMTIIILICYKHYDENSMIRTFLPLALILIVFASGGLEFELSRDIIGKNIKDFFQSSLEEHISDISKEEQYMRGISMMHIAKTDVRMKFIRDEIIILCNKLYTSGKADKDEIKELIISSSTDRYNVSIVNKDIAYWKIDNMESKNYLEGFFTFNNNVNYKLDTPEDIYEKLIFNKIGNSFNSLFKLKREMIFYYPVIDEYVKISTSLNEYVFNALKYKEQIFEFLNFKTSPSNDSYVIVIDPSGNVIAGKDNFYDLDVKTAIDRYSGKKIWEIFQLDEGDDFRFLISSMEGNLVEISGIYKYQKDLNLYFIYLINEI